MKTTVIVCAYTETRWEEMEISVSSLLQQSHPIDQIILVIDHNAELFVSARERWAEIVVIENRFQQGLSGARNSGLDAAIGEIIFFIDEDAYASPNWVEKLLTIYSDPDVVGVGGEIFPIWKSREPSWFPKEFNWVVGCTYIGMPESSQQVRNLIGCNMSFRREVFEAVGRFRDGIGRIGTIPLGCEETELCIRINKSLPSKKLIYLPEAQVFHFVSEHRGKLSYFRSRCFAEGVSKAAISKFSSGRDATSTERNYVRHVLPRGIVNALRTSFRNLEWGGVSRAASIILGFVTTSYGYVWGHIYQIFGLRTPQLIERQT